MTIYTKTLRRAAVASVALMSPLMVAKANAQDAWNAYVNSLYGFCDAKKVAAVWGKNAGEGKVIIGNKILSNLQHLVDQDIASMANRVTCSWAETELSYNDAQRLASFWGRSTPEAKQKAVRMVNEMGVKRFRQVMANALY